MTRADIFMIFLSVAAILLFIWLFVTRKKPSELVYEFVPWGVPYYYLRVTCKTCFLLKTKGNGEFSIVDVTTEKVIKKWKGNATSYFYLQEGSYRFQFDGNLFVTLKQKPKGFLQTLQNLLGRTK